MSEPTGATATLPPQRRRTPADGYRAFMIIWAAQLVARVGNGLTAFGLAVHVYQQTRSSTAVAVVMLAAFLPGVLLTPLGGVLADRFDRRLLMILGDTFSAIGLVALLVSFRHGLASVAVVCVCVALSSIFTSVMDPAYRATVTDLLTPEQYTRAGGLVQLASAAQYLISPALAGLLMARSGIQLVLVLDISTLIVTTTCMVLVRRTIGATKQSAQHGLREELTAGVSFLVRHREITVLMVLATLVTFCLGFLQTLLTPMLLELSDEQTLGLVRSGAAVGLLVSSLVISLRPMRHRQSTYLSIALAVAGITVAAMGITVDVVWIGIFTFLFFLTLPVLNTSVEVLARASIPNAVQGRVWGLMGLISQLGYIAAYAVSGVLADKVFTPLLTPDGALADTLGRLIGVGASRGIGLMLVLVAAGLLVVAVAIPRLRSIAELDTHLRQSTAQTKEI
ncbi:MAG TPA: MFS transporter [Microlunatus sp.]|jgi:DHA3 family macrolide efflux protein-like MFS transporter|nr:MFS transporter [Microlunatus sp.]